MSFVIPACIINASIGNGKNHLKYAFMRIGFIQFIRHIFIYLKFRWYDFVYFQSHSSSEVYYKWFKELLVHIRLYFIWSHMSKYGLDKNITQRFMSNIFLVLAQYSCNVEYVQCKQYIQIELSIVLNMATIF